MAARPIHAIAIAEIAAAQTLPPSHRGDAAWLTLLAAQTYGDRDVTPRVRPLTAYRVPVRNNGQISALVA